MEVPNILSKEGKLKLEMLAKQSSSNIKDAIRGEVAREELKTNLEDANTKIKPNNISDEDREL